MNYEPDDFSTDYQEDMLATQDHCLDVEGDMWKYELDLEPVF